LCFFFPPYRQFLLYTLWMVQWTFLLSSHPTGWCKASEVAMHNTKWGEHLFLCHKQTEVHNIMFVYKLEGYRNTLYNNYITDTMFSCMSTNSWVDRVRVVSDIPIPSRFDLHCQKLHMDESCENLKHRMIRFFK
jgi:hypothetical protein